jgi:hypothetical protein
MNYKKLITPLSKITLFVLIVWVIYAVFKLFHGEGTVMDVIGPICVILFFYVMPTKL